MKNKNQKLKPVYKQAPMVNWFEPAILFQTGIKSVISSLFGNYADKREMEAAFGSKQASGKFECDDYSNDEDLWIDFVSDTGDGFNPTYSIASTVAQEKLAFDIDGVKIEIPRAKILVLGGDQIYPSPTAEIYDNKFRIPFEAAFRKKDPLDKEKAFMYAIPGNHDWYDGLGNFLKVFCQQRSIGYWETRQLRSYFAIKLAHNYWLWATDIQLNEDIDKPQQDYFLDVAKNSMKQGDKVILCTAEPAWVYKQLYKKDRSYDKLLFFIEKYITKDSASCIGHTFDLPAVLTGDLHHYSRYSNPSNPKSAQYFGAGGGGAFLHLTHNLPESLRIVDENIQLQKRYPSKEKSQQLLYGNLLFPVNNIGFCSLLGFVNTFLFWILSTKYVTSFSSTYLEKINELNFSQFCRQTLMALVYMPFVTLLLALIFLGFFKFTDHKQGKKRTKIIGVAHASLQTLMVFTIIWVMKMSFRFDYSLLGENLWYELSALVSIFLLSGLMGGVLMGIYLFVSSRLNMHIDESSSSLVHQGYKNFIRINIRKEGLTVYAVGITKATKKWQQEGEKDTLVFTGNPPQCELIEEPIFIPAN